MTRVFGEEGTVASAATGKGVRSLQKRRPLLMEVDILECSERITARSRSVRRHNVVLWVEGYLTYSYEGGNLVCPNR